MSENPEISQSFTYKKSQNKTNIGMIYRGGQINQDKVVRHITELHIYMRS